MEGKRRTRPTWAQVRELEDKLADQIEGTSRLVADCDGWRELYREKSDMLELETASRKAGDELIERKRKKIKELENRIDRLMSRGFWARLLNKDV